MRLGLGLGSELQQHVDTRGAAAPARVEQGRGSVNRHSVDLVGSRDPEDLPLFYHPFQACTPVRLPGGSSQAGE